MVGIIATIMSNPRQCLECLGSAVKFQRGSSCHRMQNVWHVGELVTFIFLNSRKTECYRSWRQEQCLLSLLQHRQEVFSGRRLVCPLGQCFDLHVLNSFAESWPLVWKSLHTAQALRISFNKNKMGPATGSPIYPCSDWNLSHLFIIYRPSNCLVVFEIALTLGTTMIIEIS